MYFSAVTVLLLSTVIFCAHARSAESYDVLLGSLQQQNRLTGTTNERMARLEQALTALTTDLHFTVVMADTPKEPMPAGEIFVFGLTKSASKMGMSAAKELGTRGTFTCQQPGTYFFTVSIMNQDIADSVTRAGIFKNDEYKALTLATRRAQASTSTYVMLEKGDVVSVRCYSVSLANTETCTPLGLAFDAFTSFSGRLVVPYLEEKMSFVPLLEPDL